MPPDRTGWARRPDFDVLLKGQVRVCYRHPRHINGFQPKSHFIFLPKVEPCKGDTMPKSNSHQRRSHRKYKAKAVQKSIFDDSPTLIVNDYLVPNAYKDAVTDVITAYRQGVSFNRAVDQVHTLYAGRVNRNKLAEYTLRSIANDY